MRVFYIILFFLFFETTAFGQGLGDTLGLKGTMADTMVADRLLNEAILLNKQRRYEEAYLMADSARIIFTEILGGETKEVADALHKMGVAKYNQGKYGIAIEIYEKSKEIRLKTLRNEHPDVINSYNNLGNSYYSKGDYKKAIEYHQKALEIRLKSLGAEHPDVATSYNNIGVAYESKGEYEKAIECHQKALEIRLKALGAEHLDVASSYNNLGNVFKTKGEYEKAIECHQKALEIRLKTLGTEHLDVALSYNNLGNIFNNKGEYEKGIYFQQKALNIRIKILGLEHLDVADSYNNLGVSLNSKGEFDQALRYYEKAIEIQLKKLGEGHPFVATSYNNIGNVYTSEGQFDKGVQYHKKSLKIRLSNFGPKHNSAAGSYFNLGNSYYSKGDFDKAVEYYYRSLETFISIFGENHPNVAKSYNNLVAAYNSMGEYDKALECCQKSLSIRLKIFGNEHESVAQCYSNLGVIFESKGQYDKAIEYKRTALEICLKVLGPEHTHIAIPYNNLGVSLNSKKEYGIAIECYMKALHVQLRTLSTNNPDIAQTYTNLGETYKESGNFDEALKYYKYALYSCQFQNNKLSEVSSMLELTRAFNALSTTYKKQYLNVHEYDLLIESFKYAIEALAAIDYQVSTFTEEISKSFWRNKNYPIYEQAISISLLKANVDHNDTLRHNAFSYAEKSKASLLQAQIKAADAINFAGIPNTLLQKEHDLRIDITWREKQRQSLLDKGLTETDTNTLRISSILFDLKNNYEALKLRFETEYPEYYRLKYDLSTVSLTYVQDTLLEPKNQALLEYFVGDSSIFLFVVRPDAMIVQEVKRDFPLEDWIEGLRQGIYGYYAADKALRTDSLKIASRNKYLEFAPKLYQKLVAPVAQLLPEKVILVPDGPLGYIPFDALLTGAPEDLNDFKSYPYLIQKHQFSYTYSATLLREMRDKKHRHEPKKDFVAFAPFYTGDTTLLGNMYAYDDLMRKDLQPLDFSGPEVAVAAKLMHGETVAGAAATEERFTSTAGDYRIIHLATHGRADNRVGDYAFLAFTEVKDSIENELLYVKDLYNLQLNADLVVLSACETGIGKLQRGEGIISLARAFAYAGAKSIVTTLWSVNDKSTSELMRQFYRELQRGKDKDEALRLARLRFLKESSVRNGHPFFWAAFVPLGDMRPVR